MANSKVVVDLKHRMELCLKLIDEYAWLLDSYILDFFVEKHFQNLPQCWKHHFRHVTLEELGTFLDFQNNQTLSVWPLSLLTLRCLVKYLSLPRRPDSSNSISFDLCRGNRLELDSSNLVAEAGKNVPFNTKINTDRKIGLLLSNSKLSKLLVKHVKPKKRYEILKMAEVTANFADALNVKYIVDVGSGLGHLSRVSSFGFGLNVLSVEGQSTFSTEALKIDHQLEVLASKHLTHDEAETIRRIRPIHVQKTITPQFREKDFTDFVKQGFKQTESNFKFGIVGLHPCGNLAQTLLKLFVNCKDVKFVILVGCCYHKLTTSSENQEANGFPISKFGQVKRANISYEARALACHALETYSKRLQVNDYSHLKIHCYRATLEYIINKNWPQLRKMPLNNVKHGPQLTFKKYCESALKNNQLTVPDEDLNSENTLKYLREWKNVVIYYSLRLLLAPLIETVILIDRMLYIVEHDFHCSLETIFEPEISPRNVVLTAKKLQDREIQIIT